MKNSKKLITIFTLSALTISLNSCGKNEKTENSNTDSSVSSKEKPIVKSHEVIMQDEMTIFEELGDTLEDITDLESAKVAIPALSEIGFKFNRIKTDLQNAEPISENALKELKADFKIERRQVLTVVAENLKRIKAADVDAYSITTKIIKGITQ